MPINTDDYIQMLKQNNEQQAEQLKLQAEMIEDFKDTIKNLNATIANLQETIESLRQQIYGTSSETTVSGRDSSKSAMQDGTDAETVVLETGKETTVKEHIRRPRKKSLRKDLYDSLPIREVRCDAPEQDRSCPDCGASMEHLGYKFVREELRIIPARIERVRIMQETMVCPACREELDTTITSSKVPAALLRHSPASASMVACIMYQKSGLELPFYRQEQDWLQKGAPVPRETQANWYNTCALKYLYPVYERLHQLLLEREVIHVDEVPCQVLKEPGKRAQSRSYMWIYLSGTDGLPPIVLYDYRPGRGAEHPTGFLSGFKGMVHCDGYSAYGKLSDVILVCCLAHVRRKFFDAIPASRRKAFRLLDINSEEEISQSDITLDDSLIPAEKGVVYCNRIFYKERLYKNMDPESRKQERFKTESILWEEFWTWLGTLNPAGGSKLEKAVNYAQNHKETLMNYLLDGRCEVSNNAAERKAKAYVMGRKNFLFHGTVDGANASAIVLSLIETAKANHLNIYQYLDTLLLYMPDYKEEPAGIEQLLPWSEFVKEHCTGPADVESNTIEHRIELPV